MSTYEMSLGVRKPEPERKRCEGRLDMGSEAWGQIKENRESKVGGKPSDSEKGAASNAAAGCRSGSVLSQGHICDSIPSLWSARRRDAEAQSQGDGEGKG